ncbi:MAG TPA: hypothetical protein VLG68_06470 [Gammaproteobacteria bacterium]|nr:hypothetical protein [Gammaproteobacteria bacterium]
MRPLTFVNGVLFGSTASLGAVLGVVLLFRWVMRLDTSLDQTVVQSNLPLGSLVEYMAVFSALAAVAGLGFWGELTAKPWRGLVDGLLGFCLTAAAIFFFADPDARLAAFAQLACVALVVGLLYTALRRFGLGQYLTRWLGD